MKDKEFRDKFIEYICNDNQYSYPYYTYITPCYSSDTISIKDFDNSVKFPTNPLYHDEYKVGDFPGHEPKVIC